MLSPCSNIFKRFISHCFAFKVMHVSYQNKQTDKPNISIYKFGLPVCLFVCLFVSNKRQNGWTDRAQIFCVTLRDPREGLWLIEFSKICFHQNSIIENIENPRNFFFKSVKKSFFYNVHKENMFTMEMEDVREAP